MFTSALEYQKKIQLNQESNIGGVVQVSGVGPYSWYSHMFVLESTYSKATDKGVKYDNPDSTQSFFKWLIVYADDNTIIIKLKNLEFTSYARVMLEQEKRA